MQLTPEQFDETVLDLYACLNLRGLVSPSKAVDAIAAERDAYGIPAGMTHKQALRRARELAAENGYWCRATGSPPHAGDPAVWPKCGHPRSELNTERHRGGQDRCRTCRRDQRRRREARRRALSA